MQATPNRDLGTIAHIATPILAIFTVGVAAFLPLLLYLIANSRPEKDELLIQHLRDATNAGITMFVAGFVHVGLMLVLIGLITLPVHLIIWVIGCFKANGALKRGEPAHYPLTVRLF